MRLSKYALLMLVLSACGQSGPLYLPGDPSEVQGEAPDGEERDETEDRKQPDATGDDR